MTHKQDNIAAGRILRNFRRVFVMAVIMGSGAIYLSNGKIDPAPKLAAVPEAAIKTLGEPSMQPALLPPSFDVVSADESGQLVAAGKAQAGSTVVLHNGTQTLGETKADENGEWVLTLEKQLPAGGYVLSLSAVDPKTQARVPGQHIFALTVAPHGKSAPATGDERSKVAGAEPAAANPQLNQGMPAGANARTTTPPETAASQPQVRTKVAGVKRGDTLWAIARRFYGNGSRYGEIAGANKQQIKNPDLIYPNQQLEIPH